MLRHKTNLLVFLSGLLILLNSPAAPSQPAMLKVAGDPQAGFHVDIYKGSQLPVTSTEEFPLRFFNNDLSTIANISQWKASSFTGDQQTITPKKDSYVKEFDANLSVSATCNVLNDG